MSPRLPLALLAVVVSLLLPAWGIRGHAAGLPPGPRQLTPGYAAAPADPAAGTYAFAPGVSAINRQAFLDAAARVRPEAARLLDRVDGIVTVEDVPAANGNLGETQPTRRGYTIRMAFGDVYHRLGPRGFARVVDHELGHVVDFALVPPPLKARLDALVPPGQPCTPGTRTGSCAPRAERFAETFAKWATGDLGVNLYAGYEVPPPGDLEAWGAPLDALTAAPAPR